MLIHRYLGIAIGALMLMWCLSGVVMMYVPYPELSPAGRVRHLAPINWQACCIADASALADDASLSRMEIEMLGARPVLRLHSHGKTSLIDLRDGQELPMLAAGEAAAVAGTFSRAAGHSVQPQLKALVDRDQWTVSDEFNAARPLFLFTLGDADGTQLYVSAVSGQVVQVTTARQRFWCWFGAIPHWLYFTQLRRNVALWSQVVIWTSLAGCLLTIIGLYIGLRAWVRAGRGSAYSGVLFWHHVPGLMFGSFLLTWVSSGLVSMNPWGFLDSDSGQEARLLLRGTAVTGRQVRAALTALPALGRLAGLVSVTAAPLAGTLYLTATSADGRMQRFDETGRAAPLSGRDWATIADLLGSHRPAELLPEGDEYFLNGRQPLYRIVSDDEEQTRYYLEPATASLLASFDRNARGYRWLYQGLHTLDFTAALRGRPLRDILVLILLTGAAVTSTTGTYLGWRRLVTRSTHTQRLVKVSP